MEAFTDALTNTHRKGEGGKFAGSKMIIEFSGIMVR
jgi:hypothetical protein